MSDNNQNNSNIAEDIIDLDSIALKQKRVLRSILDSYVTGSKILVNRMHMGKTLVSNPKAIPSYVGSINLKRVAGIQMGHEMPFMKESIDKDTGKLQIDKDNVRLLTQRAPDWTRQPALAAYLTAKPFHKFSTILVVYNPTWVDKPDHENWSEGRAIKDAIEFEPLDSMGRFGLIDIENNVSLYALDGQHRVMGVRGIKELIDENELKLKNKAGKGDKKQLSIEEWLEEFKIDIGSLRDILNETMSIEFIPSVIAGETREEATQRLRSVFVALNTYAKKTTKSEAELLDEDNGYSVLASSVATTHPLFVNTTNIKNRVNFKNTTISKTNTFLTTFEAISNSAENYLRYLNEERHDAWKPRFSGQVPIRPENHEIEKAREEYKEYLNHLHQLPVFQSIERGENIIDLREFPDAENPEDSSKLGHLLLRPIGQQILAMAVGKVINKHGMSLKEIFAILSKKDKEGKFSGHKPQNLWFGITYNIPKPSMLTSNQGIAVELFEYLIKGLNKAEHDSLLDRVKDFRSSPGKDGNRMWIDFNGATVKLNEGSEYLPL